MNLGDKNINKDMNDSSLIDVETLDFLEDHQTWLYKVPNDSNQHLDVVDWNVSCDWSAYEDNEYPQSEKKLYSLLDNILKSDKVALDKHKFDSRTYVRPKKRAQRPSIQNIVEAPTHSSSTPNSQNKYLTYNKYNFPSPMLRLKTFNVDTNTDNSTVVKEFASKRKSLVQEDDGQLEDLDADPSERLSSEHLPSKPVNFDLSQPAHNLHTTFNRGMSNIMNERGSLNMFQSGESLMRMSPPSLVSSLMMESSGNFNPESMESKKSMSSQRDSGIPNINRDSIDPMVTSMTLSILDEKDMNTSFLSQTTADNGPSSIQNMNSHRESLDPNMVTSMTLSILEDKDMRTSFLSQTTYPDNESMLDSLPPSLVSSVNTSCVSNTSKKQSIDPNIFSSTTFTHLEQSEKLLSARPRCQMFNSFKRDSLRNSESYTKSREEACQIDTTKVLNENGDKPKKSLDMTETVTLHYSNNKMRRNEEKENLNSTFEKDDAFYNDMGMQKVVELGKNSMNVTLDKQELNEIIQARQKLSLARKGLPESEKLPNQIQDNSPIKTIQLPNQTTITVPKHSMENASELLSRRRALNGYDKEDQQRETPRRNATFKKVSPKANSMDATVVFMKEENNIIDINSATMNLTTERTLQAEEWGSQERAMVGSSESTDTATFSSSSPPESVPESVHDPRLQVASTPLMSIKKGVKNDLLNLHSTISPIYDLVDDKSYILTKAGSANSTGTEKTYDMHSTTVINSATMVKKSSAKRDILAGKVTPEKKVLGPTLQRMSPQNANKTSPTRTVSYSTMAPPGGLPRKTGLPTSKLLRQYSSHKELRIPGPTLTAGVPRALPGRTMTRRGVYSSNPALSPTSQPQNSDSYTVTTHYKKPDESAPLPKPPVLIRQGTETLRRERPQSQLVAPKDHRGSMGGYGMPQPTRNYHMPPPATRPYSIAGASQLRVARPTSVPINKQAHSAAPEQRPTSSSTEQRVSALPRPSRLPAPRRALRPPSVYSVAPTNDPDFY